MKIREMDKLTNHFDTYFEQSDCMVMHPIVDDGFHVDMLIYKPTAKYPFWKLATLGASDYKMPKISNTIGLYNEYIMFVDKNVDMTDKTVANWYHNKLAMVASFAYYNKTHITYSHSLEWKNDDPDDEMIAAFIEFPQIIENVSLLRCKLGFMKEVACLQVVLLNKEELDLLMNIGPQAFSEYLYPENGSAAHFISERKRSGKF
jgi:hypothetical protein